MNAEQTLLQEILIPASREMRTTCDTQQNAICQSTCGGGCNGITVDNDLPAQFYA